jgi:hypothetical protein
MLVRWLLTPICEHCMPTWIGPPIWDHHHYPLFNFFQNCEQRCSWEHAEGPRIGIMLRSNTPCSRIQRRRATGGDKSLEQGRGVADGSKLRQAARFAPRAGINWNAHCFSRGDTVARTLSLRGGKSRGTPARVLSFAPARGWLFLETSQAASLLGVLLRGDEVASLATVTAAEPLTWKWSKLLRLPFPTSAACLGGVSSGSFERRPQHG